MSNSTSALEDDSIPTLFLCRIMHTLMEDPVMLVENGYNYDRKHLCRWLLENPNRDPSNLTLYEKPLTYASAVDLRQALMERFGDEAYVKYNDSKFRMEYDKLWEELRQKSAATSTVEETNAVQITSNELVKLDRLGVSCFNGINGKKDYVQAVRWFKLAAEQGYALSQCNLGLMYQYGNGIEKDCKMALKWYKLAADQGYAKAQFNLGLMYHCANGVEQDRNMAVTWYKLAADHGYANAQCNLGFMYQTGKGVQRDYAMALKWYQLAADQGNATAQSNLGFMYQTGKGVQRSYNMALKWYQLAADQGLARARKNLRSLRFRMLLTW